MWNLNGIFLGKLVFPHGKLILRIVNFCFGLLHIISCLIYFKPLGHVLKSASWENFSVFIIFSYWPSSLEHFLFTDFCDYRNYFYIIYNKNKVSAIFPFKISLNLVLWHYNIFPCFLNLKNPSDLSSISLFFTVPLLGIQIVIADDLPILLILH